MDDLEDGNRIATDFDAAASYAAVTDVINYDQSIARIIKCQLGMTFTLSLGIWACIGIVLLPKPEPEVNIYVKKIDFCKFCHFPNLIQSVINQD